MPELSQAELTASEAGTSLPVRPIPYSEPHSQSEHGRLASQAENLASIVDFSNIWRASVILNKTHVGWPKGYSGGENRDSTKSPLKPQLTPRVSCNI